MLTYGRIAAAAGVFLVVWGVVYLVLLRVFTRGDSSLKAVYSLARKLGALVAAIAAMMVLYGGN